VIGSLGSQVKVRVQDVANSISLWFLLFSQQIGI